MSGYSVKQFSRKGNGAAPQQSAPPGSTFYSPAAAAPNLFAASPHQPAQPQRQPPLQPPLQPAPPQQHRAQPQQQSFQQPGMQPPSHQPAASPPSRMIPGAQPGMAPQQSLPSQQLYQQQQQQQQQRPNIMPPPNAATRPTASPQQPPTAGRSNPFSPAKSPQTFQPQQPLAPSLFNQQSPPQAVPSYARPQPAATPISNLQPPQSAWQRRAAATSQTSVYEAANQGHDAAYGDGSDMAAEEFVQPTTAHRAYTTTAQRRQAPPPPPPSPHVQQQHQQPSHNQYRAPPIQPSQAPAAVPSPVETVARRSLLDDDDDMLENLPEELFNLNPQPARGPTAVPAGSAAGASMAIRRPLPSNMPVQPLPSAGGQAGHLTPTKRKADDANIAPVAAPTRQQPPAPPPPRPLTSYAPQQLSARQPQPDVQFNAHLNAVVTATPARTDMVDGVVKSEGAEGAGSFKQESGDYVRLTKKERAQLVLAKTKAEEKAAEERARAAEERRKAAEEREKREQAEAALAVLRTNLNNFKQETARNAAQSSQHKVVQSQQAEQAKHALEVNYQTVKMERDDLEMQLNDKIAQLRRAQQQLLQREQQPQPQLKMEVPQVHVSTPMTSSPPSSQASATVKQQRTAMDTTDDAAAMGTTAASAAAASRSSPVRSVSSPSPASGDSPTAVNEALMIEAFRKLAPSLLGPDQTEGQRVASQLLTVPLSTDKDAAEPSSTSSPLIALLYSLNSYIANQPTATTHSASQPLSSNPASLPPNFPSVTQHISHHVKELESSTMQVRDGALPPDALLSPTCHLLNSLCNISSVPVDLALFPATQPAGAPRRMKAIDDIIAQLLNIMLVVLRSSPTCRRTAVRGLSSSGVSTASRVIAPAVYQHPLYAFRPAKGNQLSRRLSDRAAGSNNDLTDKDREANEQLLKERAEQQQKQRADTNTAAVSLPLNYPDPIPLLLNIVQSFQRINPRSQADLFIQPALSCLLLLLDTVVAVNASPTAFGFAALLDEKRLLPLLCRNAQGVQQTVSLAVHCVAVQLFGLLVVDHDALRLVAYRPTSTVPSLLRCLYSNLLSDSDRGDKSLTDAKLKDARSRQHGSHRLAPRDIDSGDKWLSADKRLEVQLSTRQHVVRLMAFVTERYGAVGVQWLSNEREREESKEGGGDDTVVVDGDRDEHSILTLLVRMMTAEMQQIAAAQRAYDPLHSLHSTQPSSASLFRDRRPDAMFPLTQPANTQPPNMQQSSSVAARSMLQTMRVALVKESMQLSARLITESIPTPSHSARRAPLLPTVASQLAQCSHLLLTLLADIRSSTIGELNVMGDDADKLKAALLESRLLSSGGEEY